MKKLSPPTSIPERPVFRGFDVDEPWLVPGYRRNLPHLRLEDATYFVTFRLVDSIPEAVALQWHDERQRWLEADGVEPAWAEFDLPRWKQAYFAISPGERRAFEREQQRRFLVELDKCHGSCLLEKAHGIVADALEFFHGKRVWKGDYVVIPNHVHVLVQPFPGVNLEEWLYSIKRFTSTGMGKDSQLNAHAMMRQGHLWQTESFDRIVRGVEELARTRRYIANNPAKLRPGRFVLKPMEWLDEFAARGSSTFQCRDEGPTVSVTPKLGDAGNVESRNSTLESRATSQRGDQTKDDFARKDSTDNE
jgi:type I restriction enzyme R subunit